MVVYMINRKGFIACSFSSKSNAPKTYEKIIKLAGRLGYLPAYASTTSAKGWGVSTKAVPCFCVDNILK